MRALFRRTVGVAGGAKRGVLAIASGSLIGQVILAASTPLLSRLYPPESFGAFSLVLAISAIVGPAATLKYEAALMLPKHEDDARRLLRLGMASAFAISGLASLVVWVLAAAGLAPGWGEIAFAPLWVGGMTLATATFAVLTQAALRERSYATVARRSISQSIGVVVGQTLLGLVTPGPAGLLGGFLAGRCLGYAALFRAVRPLLKRPAEGSYRDLVRRYWRFPLVFMPSGLLNALGSQLPLILIATWFGAASAGELAMAQRLVFIPVTLIGASIGEVFGAELSARIRGSLGENARLYLKTSLRMSYVALLVVPVLLIAAPAVLPFILGDLWPDSGLYAQAMAISVGLGLIATPVSKVFVTLQRSFPSIAVDISRLVLIGIAAWVAHSLDMSAIEATWLLYIAQGLNYVITWLYGLRIVVQSDKQAAEGLIR